MNTGIGDAVNLAWKLAEVLRGRASEKILATYEVERRAFAEVLVQTTDRAFRIVASRSFLGSTLRTYIMPTLLGLLTRFKFVLKFMFLTLSQIRRQQL